MSSRHERRQQHLGRAPVVVAMPTMTKKPRLRKTTKKLQENCALFEIGPGRPEDSKTFAQMYERYVERTGFQPIMLDPASPMMVARHKVTGTPFAFVTVKPVMPGKLYVENLLAAPTRWGQMAARALIEKIMSMGVKKVCVVHAGNAQMLRIVEHYGGRVIGLLIEGPYDGTAAAEPLAEAHA